MRLVVRWSMGLVALAAAALSYQSLMTLAALAGYGRLAILYPLVVDCGAAASCAAWLHTRGRQPLAMTWCLLAVSVVLNGTTHYLTSTHTAPSWLLVVAVAAVPPTVLGLCVHLAVGMGGPGRFGPMTGGPGHMPEGAEGPQSTQPALSESAQLSGGVRRPDQQQDGLRALAGSTTTADVTDGATEISDPVAELLAQGAGRRKLAAELNITEHQARQLIAAAKNGDGHA